MTNGCVDRILSGKKFGPNKKEFFSPELTLHHKLYINTSGFAVNPLTMFVVCLFKKLFATPRQGCGEIKKKENNLHLMTRCFADSQSLPISIILTLNYWIRQQLLYGLTFVQMFSSVFCPAIRVRLL